MRMASSTISPRARERPGAPRTSVGHVLVFGAPIAALAAGLAAEWLDFRALRYPLLLIVGAGVLATAWSLFAVRPNVIALMLTVGMGAATWAAAETLYVVLHLALGGRFSFEAAGPQWAQAVLLIILHASLLGVPTGVAAALALRMIAGLQRAVSRG
jgi:hypothetical protein